MSYYSDAAAVMYKKDYEKIKEKIFAIDDEYDKEYFTRATLEERDDLVIIKWDNVNHFGSNSLSMKMFLDFLYTVPHSFIRIGEGVDDQVDIEVHKYNFEDVDEWEKFSILGYHIDIVVYD